MIDPHFQLGVDVRVWIELSRPADGDVGDTRFRSEKDHSILFPAPYQPIRGSIPSWEALGDMNASIMNEYMECPFWNISGFLKTDKDFILDFDGGPVGCAPLPNDGFNHNIPNWFRVDARGKIICFPAPSQPLKHWMGDPEVQSWNRNDKFLKPYADTFGITGFRQYTSFLPEGEKRGDCFYQD